MCSLAHCAEQTGTYLETAERLLGPCDLREDVVGAGGPDEGPRLALCAAMYRSMAISSSATLVKLARLMRFSERSRKKRSTMLSQDAARQSG